MTEIAFEILDKSDHVNRLCTGHILDFFTNHFSHGRNTRGSHRIIRLSQVLPELEVSAPAASLLGDESEGAQGLLEFARKSIHRKI